MVNRVVRVLVFLPLLMALVATASRPGAAEEGADAPSIDPEALFEGLAPLAKHGPWTVETSDDRSPEPHEIPRELPAEHREDFGKRLTRLTRREYKIAPKTGWSRSIVLAVQQYETAD